jgi:4-carboxymuconolactone decarboxylase
MNMGNYLRLETSVPRALNEFVIMIQCRIRACNFAFWAHARLGREFGVKDEIIADLEAGRRPQAMSELEVATFDFCTELELRNRVCETTYAKLKSHLSDQQIVDLTSVFGFYAMTSMALNLNETEITEDGVVAFDPDVVPFQAA